MSSNKRYCTQCGKREGQVKFASVFTPRCTSCTTEINAAKSQRKLRYRNARARALTRLSALYPYEYQDLLKEEQARDRQESKDSQKGAVA